MSDLTPDPETPAAEPVTVEIGKLVRRTLLEIAAMSEIEKKAQALANRSSEITPPPLFSEEKPDVKVWLVAPGSGTEENDAQIDRQDDRQADGCDEEKI